MQPLRQVLVTYFAVNLRINSDKTRRKYQYSLNDFEAFLGRESRLSDLSDDTIAAMMRNLLDTKGLEPRTVNDRRDCLRALWEWCARRGMVQQWPTIPKLKVPHREPIAFTIEEIRRLLDACHQCRGNVGDIPASLWWATLVRVAWCSGERVSALLSLQWQHVDTSTGWIYLPAEDRKGRTRDRRYRLDDAACKMLNMIAFPVRELVFPWPYCGDYIWNRFGKILERADLPNSRMFKFHAIRKSHASYLHLAGADACAAMGHSSPDVTQQFYLDKRITQVQQPIDSLPGLDE